MPIRDTIEQIAKEWPGYLANRIVDSRHPVYELVTKTLPAEIEKNAGEFSNLIVEGSTGKGNITPAPWVALFDQRLTTSATLEYYVVYLFSTDLSEVTLSLAFGKTQFENQFSPQSKVFQEMRTAAERLQNAFKHIIPEHLQRGPIDLRANPSQKNHYAYQQSSILSFSPYRINALPTEGQLIANLQEICRIYTDMVESPMEMSVDRLVEAIVVPAKKNLGVTVKDFEIQKQIKAKGTKDGRGGQRRYSPQSRKVGDAGEKVVFDYEKEHLVKLGRKDLAEKVRWHASRGEYVGWDITSYDDQGEEVLIEVKASMGKTISSVQLTDNEWQAARESSKREKYYLYIVTNALSENPTIERLRNPAGLVDGLEISCEPIVYELKLK